ncbi:DUF726-domain-containing protein [Lichtheimia hyalospora FSU 10163]|nr:DUF726-domain-containing protein [Lichtheimia hyalospora FSU 10163]
MPPIQNTTSDVFTEAQKVAFVGLCAVTSLEIVHSFHGKEYAYARMSADNWQRKLMRDIYKHMDVSLTEIGMIEDLFKHGIQATDLVLQFIAQATTTTTVMDSTIAATSTHDTVELDLRWTVMCSLLLLFLNAENFDARTRVFLSRTASYLQLDWRETLIMEQWISDQFLGQQSEDENMEKSVMAAAAYDMFALPVANANEKRYRNRERRKHRYAMIGLATVGGGLILGVSAGLMSPLIAGGMGTLLSTIGVSGAGSFFGSTAGIAMITGSMTSIGGAKSMKRRMKTINTFEFQPVAVNGHPSCIVTVSGTLDPLIGDHYALHWEPEMLQDLGSAFKIFATEVVAFSIQQALTHTIMGALLAGLAWPLALTKLGYLVDNPWHNGLDRARLAGLILADSLMNRNLGNRPVTLVGYSLGARVIFYCLLELARVNAHGLVENVALFGTPVSASQSQWEACISVVSGRFVNGYSKNDWLLGFLFRASTAGLNNVAGLRPLKSAGQDKENCARVMNIDCTDILKGHLSYRTCMPKLLKRAGFLVTSEELPDRVKETEEEENNSDNVVLDLSGAKVCI